MVTEPFKSLSPEAHDAFGAEVARLVRFVHDAEPFVIRLAADD